MTTTNNKSNWKAILPLCMVLFFDAMSWGFILPELGPMFLSSHGLFGTLYTGSTRIMLYSLVIGIPMFFLFIGASLMGTLSDRIGRKKAILIGLSGIIVSNFLCILALVFRSVGLLLFARAFLGLMDGNESVAQAAMADISDSSNNVHNMSLVTLAGTVGFILGPLCGGYLVDPSIVSWFGLTTPFYFSSLFSLVSAVLLGVLFKETFVPNNENKPSIWQSYRELLRSLREKKMFKLTVGFFAMEMPWAMYFVTITLLLSTQYHFTSVQIGHFLTIMSLTFMVTLSVLIRLFLRWFYKTTVIQIGLVLIVLGTLTMIICHTFVVDYWAVIPISMGVGLSYNNLLALFSENASDEIQGQVMGFTISLVSLCWLVASLLGAELASFATYAPYVLMMVCAAIGFVAFIGFPRR